MKREWLLASATGLVTLMAGLALIRWLAPQLLGLPIDLRLVGVQQALPPFYDGVFRPSDYLSSDSILNDPVTVTRLRPRLPERGGTGPHDLLGFRNRSVPNVADVVVVGDSQTYGNNALLEQAWPKRLAARLGLDGSTVYSMAAGGWSAVQYLDMALKATTFQPQVLVVAFYTGNDPLEAFRVAYATDGWPQLRVDPELDAADAPRVEFPAPIEDHWAVSFDVGVRTVFKPGLRLTSNLSHPAVEAGYEIMARVASEISAQTARFGLPIVFLVIPTKELVHAELVRGEGLTAPEAYNQLVKAESRRLAALAGRLARIPRAHYVDVLGPMRAAVASGRALYPHGENGHPIEAGYDVIAETLAPTVGRLLPERPRGVYGARYGPDEMRIALVKGGGVWFFAGRDLVVGNGWHWEVPETSPRTLAGLPRCGIIREIDPARFGPTVSRYPSNCAPCRC